MKYLKFYIQTLWYNYSLNPSKILRFGEDLTVSLVGFLVGVVSYFTLPFTVIYCVRKEIKRDRVDWNKVKEKSWFSLK